MIGFASCTVFGTLVRAARRTGAAYRWALLSRCMRCVQWLAKRQRERIDVFATGAIHYLKPSNEAAN